MNSQTINLNSREIGSKKSLRELRSSGYVPAVIYDGNGESLFASIEHRDLDKAVQSTYEKSQIFSVESSDSNLQGSRVIIKDIEIEPLKQQITHVDLYKIDESKPVVFDIPIELKGESPIVKQGLAIAQQSLYSLKVKGLVADVTDKIIANITSLTVGQSITAKEIELPERLSLKTPAGTTVASVFSKAKVAQVEEEEEATETAETATKPEA